MKFISVVALLAPVVLAAPQARDDSGWIGLIKEQCPNMSEQCVGIAMEAHKPLSDIGQITQAMPACTPAYVECINLIAGDASDVSTFPQDVTQGELATCLQRIAPDHIKYFLDNDRAYTPIPYNQNCALRELHRVAHVELGPLA
ncbi:hypothetical protein BDV35DRAFT_388271 [Aspergillus flavus]|uniref:DNA, SC023 n=4 Tax=Aspergillus subgen. Circumdati TaxID=2720871 RepID=Q2UIC4_ASPOR|nr:unnamed protein product [Aspergillus oryzae RIB40]EIT75262.1 hypothetical protein Ao3042_08710 [Aspergillus oryzae 3.042]KAB8251286.1 hypothetical protein BDV35DRAFT_388271 [Aspergillus flavus]KDE76187.1 hypothetical protein AO1008_01964 [Aspergillus oryzae 100-8]OOO13770.1 hypothetical protein OAory_01023650 [Aspergillus oryzae]BAE58691.1 unnamed protein product [Aspergillus oryzae RIB40]|eukprot:EIT75262.1 hypothetical protein Ao3042_08710 [Aspergillus oryzae 3.042]